MRELRVEELLEKIGSPVEVVGDASGVAVSRVAPIDDADETALVWLSPDHPSRDRLLRETRARVRNRKSLTDWWVPVRPSAS